MAGFFIVWIGPISIPLLPITLVISFSFPAGDYLPQLLIQKHNFTGK